MNWRRASKARAQAGRPLLLEGGLDWKPLSLTPKDMDFIEAKNVAAREIALAIGVPPMLLGIPGDNTYSNDPYDPGGPTNRGITLEVYAAFKGETVNAETRPRFISELKRIPMSPCGRSLLQTVDVHMFSARDPNASGRRARDGRRRDRA